MYSIDELFEDTTEWYSFHDVICEIELQEYSSQKLRVIFENLPIHIKDIAQTCGLSDTVFRDEAYVFLLKNKHIIKDGTETSHNKDYEVMSHAETSSKSANADFIQS